jgi:type IV pilus assembly protein PilA
MLDYKSIRNSRLQAGNEAGFTLIELMIIIAILVNMAMVSYKDYLVRSKISRGVVLAAPAKSAVSEYYSNTGMLPADNNAAGLAAANTISNDYVTSVVIGTVPSTGTITITYNMPELNPGDSILLRPEAGSGSMKWTCYSTTMKRTMLPSSCR